MQQRELLEQEISLKQLSLHVIEIPHKSAFKSGIGTRNARRALIVRWEDASGQVGYGECSCRQDPYYSAEFLDGVVTLIQKFIIPFLKPGQTYQQVLAILKRIRGWPFSKAAVEAAVFQVARKQFHFELSSMMKAEPVKQVPVGISLGIYTDKKELYDVVQQSIEVGYQRIKFKIAPFVDTDLFDHINPLLFDNNVYTGFDANGSYDYPDIDKLGYFVNTYHTIMEQPFPVGQFGVFLEAKKRYPGLRVCFDEEVKSIGDLIKLHKLQAIDELNLKLGRVGGVTNSIEIINYCYDHDIPCWIGGMFETGIGRILNLEFASFLPKAKGHDLSPSQRYFVEDIVNPGVTMKDGFVDMESTKESEVVPEIMKKYEVEKIVYQP